MARMYFISSRTELHHQILHIHLFRKKLQNNTKNEAYISWKCLLTASTAGSPDSDNWNNSFLVGVYLLIFIK